MDGPGIVRRASEEDGFAYRGEGRSVSPCSRLSDVFPPAELHDAHLPFTEATQQANVTASDCDPRKRPTRRPFGFKNGGAVAAVAIKIMIQVSTITR